ncbi:alcohol dehydrogenase [Carex littledalei]|uniref:alcohol dehydrogenase n=1 Tax=Carex littledalei TaxID=544730 RepID=A0A833VV50_9POAL|nr:alcohol dehydrogenase [Carex littledalei]
MCDLLRTKTDRGAMIGNDQSGLSISGKPIYHFVVTSIFNGYAVIHFDCVAKINPESPLAKVCVLSCGILTGLDATFNVTRPLKGFTVVISVLVTVALVIFKHVIKAIGMSADLSSFQSQPITTVSSNDDKKAEEKKE